MTYQVGTYDTAERFGSCVFLDNWNEARSLFVKELRFRGFEPPPHPRKGMSVDVGDGVVLQLRRLA